MKEEVYFGLWFWKPEDMALAPSLSLMTAWWWKASWPRRGHVARGSERASAKTVEPALLQPARGTRIPHEVDPPWPNYLSEVPPPPNAVT